MQCTWSRDSIFTSLKWTKWFLFCHICRMVPIVTQSHTFNGPFSGTTRVSRYQKGKTHLDFTKARDSEWQWHASLQLASDRQPCQHPTTRFLQAGCLSCCPTNSIKALKAVPIVSAVDFRYMWQQQQWQCPGDHYAGMHPVISSFGCSG